MGLLRRSGEGTGVRRVKRELLKIDGKTVEVILRTNPRARRFIAAYYLQWFEILLPRHIAKARALRRARPELPLHAGVKNANGARDD